MCFIFCSANYVFGESCWWRSWLGHFAKSRKVTGSFLGRVTRIFHWHNPSGRTMALGFSQPLIELSTRNISWGVKAGGAYGWQPYHLHVTIDLKSGSLSLLEPSGPVQACNGISVLIMSLLETWNTLASSSEMPDNFCHVLIKFGFSRQICNQLKNFTHFTHLFKFRQNNLERRIILYNNSYFSDFNCSVTLQL